MWDGLRQKIVLVLEGFVTVSAEIIAIRQLLPYVGNSVIVTSLIIGIFLLFLAYGYRQGGAYEADFERVLHRNFIFAALFMGLGFSYAGLAWFFSTFYELFQHHLPVLFLYLLLILAPLAFLLGQSIPIVSNLFPTLRPAEISARTLQYSTMGSFLGAVLTSTFLMTYAGVAWTLVIDTAILLFLAGLVRTPQNTSDGFYIQVLGLGLVVLSSNVFWEKYHQIKSNAYADYQVMSTERHSELGNGKLLMINHSASSFLNPQQEGFEYIQFIRRRLFQDLKIQDKNILVLGAGGFTLSAADDFHNHFTYVDIDPKIKSIVKHSFLETIKGKFIAADARTFLKTNEQKFDVIVSDTYSHREAIPAQLLTQEYFLEIRRTLTSGGLAVFNIIGEPFLKDHYSEHIDNTIRSVFSCVAIPLQFNQPTSNIIYFCKIPSSAEIFTDDKNKSTIESF